MRSRIPLFALLLLVGSVALAIPLAAHAGAEGGIPFFGPIIPPENPLCPLGWGMFIQVINRIISFLLTLAIVFVAPIMIAYSGFLFVVNPVNPSGISRAREVLVNTVVGIVIALAAWMIVDAVTVALYDPSATTSSGQIGTWSELIRGDANPANACLKQMGTNPDDGLNQTTEGPGVSAAHGPGTHNTTPSTDDGNACNPETITNAVPSATDQQAKRLACIAQGESTCGQTRAPENYNDFWNKATKNGKASTAVGAYQVLLSTHSECYDNPVCEEVAGTPGVKLNCRTGFDNKGFIKAGSETVVDKCVKAASSIPCSAAAAVCVLNKQSFARAYLTDPYMASCQAAFP